MVNPEEDRDRTVGDNEQQKWRDMLHDLDDYGALDDMRDNNDEWAYTFLEDMLEKIEDDAYFISDSQGEQVERLFADYCT